MRQIVNFISHFFYTSTCKSNLLFLYRIGNAIVMQISSYSSDVLTNFAVYLQHCK